MEVNGNHLLCGNTSVKLGGVIGAWGSHKDCRPGKVLILCQIYNVTAFIAAPRSMIILKLDRLWYAPLSLSIPTIKA